LVVPLSQVRRTVERSLALEKRVIPVGVPRPLQRTVPLTHDEFVDQGGNGGSARLSLSAQ
jgi:hypothetical protein